MVEAHDANNAEAFVLVIKPAEGDDPAPSAAHIVGGDFASGVASLPTSHGAALGTDFADVAGTFILETPTPKATED